MLVNRLGRLDWVVRCTAFSCSLVVRRSLNAMAAAAGLLALPVLAQEPAPASAEPKTGSFTNAGPYMRVARPDTNTVELQIVLRQFLPQDAKDPAIWLVAVSHIGESNYFSQLQSFLNQQGLVLFEGVGYAEGRRKSKAQPSATDDTSAQDAEPGGTSSLQSTLATSLGLAFQLDAIDYEQKNFKNSDMSMTQIQELMVKQMEKEGAGERESGNPEFLALMAAMEGSSWLGAFLHVGVRLLGSSPKLQAMTRLMLIEVLGGIQGDMSEMKGLPPEIQDLMRVLIQERNGVVLRDVKKALARRSKPFESIAVFYGAAHMDNMERRLVQDLDYRFGKDVWMTAITVQPGRAGLNDTEIKTIRGLVQWQMEALQEHFPEAGDKKE